MVVHGRIANPRSLVVAPSEAVLANLGNLKKINNIFHILETNRACLGQIRGRDEFLEVGELLRGRVCVSELRVDLFLNQVIPNCALELKELLF